MTEHPVTEPPVTEPPVTESSSPRPATAPTGPAEPGVGARLVSTSLASPVGRLELTASDEGLRAVRFTEPGPHAGDRLEAHGEHPVLSVVVQQLREYFASERTDLDVPVELVGTDFQLAAWLALRHIPCGQTVTYGTQAERIGRPGAVRALGAANARNPLPIVLPCHRVVGASGALTGYTASIDVKRWLLEHEAAMVADRSPSGPEALP